MLENKNSIGDLSKATAVELSNAFATGEISPVEVTKLALTQAEQINEELNAFSLIDHDGAILAAKESEKRWKKKVPLSDVDGIPTTIKDIVFCGLDVRYGSLVTGDVSSQPDAPSVKGLREAGTILLGLTNTPEFGWKAITDNPRNGITRNPWDKSKTPGGSSGGAAVAAATGTGVFHLGTDGGGSIRIPASFCGIVGHKPSFGKVAAYPPSAFGTVAHIGPMTRTVGDTALMLNAMAGADSRDWSQPLSPASVVQPKPLELKNLRIGFWNTPCVGGVDSEVSMAVKSTLEDFALAEAKIEEISLPQQDELLEIFHRHWLVGAANRLSSIDQTEHASLDPGFLRAAQTGAKYTAVERIQAEIARAEFGMKMDALLAKYDFVLSPTVPIPAFEAGADVPMNTDYRSWMEWSTYSFPINLSQQPACSIPCGETRSGLPIGLQVIGGRGQDERVLSLCLTYEQMFPNRFLIPGSKWPAYAG